MNKPFVVLLVMTLLLSGRALALEVASAKRVEKFSDPKSTTEVAPTEPNEVVLIIDLSGISLEEFHAVPREQIAVMAAERRFEPHLTLSRDWFMVDGDNRPVGGVQKERRIVVVVPRDVLNFSMQFGKRPPLMFKADPNITAVLPQLSSSDFRLTTIDY